LLLSAPIREFAVTTLSLCADPLRQLSLAKGNSALLQLDCVKSAWGDGFDRLVAVGAGVYGRRGPRLGVLIP